MSCSRILNNAAANSGDHQTERIQQGLDPVSFTYLKANMYREHQNALEKVKFRQQQGDDWKYLDLGCGPGNFLEDILLPRLRPCKCVVAVDSSREMLSYAQQHHHAHEVFFELLDIEHGNPDEIVAKYGQFDRAYAFLVFPFVKDLNQAYRNVYKLLRQGGECLAVDFVRTGVSDVWHQIYEKDEWKEYVPNPVEVLSKRHCFNEEVPQEKCITEEMNAAAAAGLDIVDCHTYASQWIFPTADAWLEIYVGFFKLDQRVPEERRREFWDALKIALLEEMKKSSDGVSLKYDIMVTHMQKP